MDRKRLVFIIGVIMNLLLSISASFDLMAEILASKLRLQSRKRKRDDDGDAPLAAMSIMLPASYYNFRRHWVSTRSSHWNHGVESGALLPGEQFPAFFRLTRNSFAKLHDVLGTSCCLLWLIFSVLHS